MFLGRFRELKHWCLFFHTYRCFFYVDVRVLLISHVKFAGSFVSLSVLILCSQVPKMHDNVCVYVIISRKPRPVQGTI